MKIVSAFLKLISEDKPTILVNEDDIKEIIFGKSSLYFGFDSFTLTELDYKIQQIFEDEKFDSEVSNATDFLIYVSGGEETPLQIFNKIADELRQHLKSEIQIKLGLGYKDDGDKIHVYILGSKNMMENM